MAIFGCAPIPPLSPPYRIRAWSAAALFLLLSCSTRETLRMPAQAVPCSDPRPQICTMDYTPVCATRDRGIRCVTTPCATTETASYANACSACADVTVLYHVPGACEE